MSGEWIELAAPPLAATFVTALVLSWLATGAVLRQLRRRAILDGPTERPSHAVPTPRGGGIGMLAALLPAWCGIVLLGYGDASSLAVAAAVLILAVVSWRDDVGGLSPAIRLVVQALAVIAGLVFLPGAGTVFQDLLPAWLDRAASALLWLWVVNAFNFMDGIDGIAGTEAAAIGAGIALLALFPLDAIGLRPRMLGAPAAGPALGFVGWTWPPGKVPVGHGGSGSL